MALTAKQRRENIEKALARVRASKGGTTGGVQKGARVKGSGAGIPTSIAKDVKRGQVAVRTASGDFEIISKGEFERRQLALQRKRGETIKVQATKTPVKTVTRAEAKEQAQELKRKTILSLSKRLDLGDIKETKEGIVITKGGRKTVFNKRRGYNRNSNKRKSYTQRG